MRSGTAKPRDRKGLPGDTLAAIVTSIFLVILNILRVMRVPITHDEAPNPAGFVYSYSNFIHLTPTPTANTHILNSILRKFFTDVLSNTPFVLRLDNILAHIMFLVFSWLLVNKIVASKWWRLGAFLFLNLNPFLFEFWGLSRGYGLAIAFNVASVYYLVLYTEMRKMWQLAACLALGIAAVYSNFALLNYVAAVVAYLVFCAIFSTTDDRRTFLKKGLPGILTCAALLFLLIAEPIKKLVAAKELYYGGDRGVISDSLHSIVKESMYLSDQSSTLIWTVTCFLVAFTVVASAYSLITFFKGTASKETKMSLMFCLLMLSILVSIELQHALFGTKYLIDRTALFFYPLLVLVIVSSLYQLRKKRVAGVVFGIFVLLTSYNFAQNISTDRSRLWWTDNYNLVVLKKILAENPRPKNKIRLRVNWVFMPSLNYYIRNRYAQLIDSLEYIHEPPKITDTMYDYMYLTNDDIASLPPVYRRDTSFIGNGFVLFKNSKLLKN